MAPASRKEIQRWVGEVKMRLRECRDGKGRTPLLLAGGCWKRSVPDDRPEAGEMMRLLLAEKVMNE